jgi:hypothetical protein
MPRKITDRAAQRGSLYTPPEITPQTNAEAILTKRRADIEAEIAALTTPQRVTAKRPKLAAVKARAARLAALEAELEALDFHAFDVWDAERYDAPTVEAKP